MNEASHHAIPELAGQKPPSSQGQGSTHKTSKDHSKANWAALLIALPFAIQAIACVTFLLRILPLRGEAIDAYPETSCVFAFLTAFHTRHLYLSPYQFPWNEEVYGPLFYMLGTLFAVIFHGAPTPVTVSMRAVSFISLIASAALVCFMCLHLERQKTWAAVTVTIGLSCFWIAPWASAVRPDLPSVFLVLAALAVYQRSEGRLGFIFLAGILAAAATLTKQTTIPVMLVLVIDCLWDRRIKAAGAVAAGEIVAVAAVFVPLWLRQEPFFANFLATEHLVPNWRSIPYFLTGAMQMDRISAIPILIALIGAVVVRTEKRYRVVLLTTSLAWLSSVAALANTGGNWNYLILPWFLTMLFVPAGLRQLEGWTRFSLWAPATLFALAMAAIVHQKNPLRRMVRPNTLDPAAIANTTLLGDIPYLEARSREPQLLDPFFYSSLTIQNAWSDRPIRQRIDAEHYDLLLINGYDDRAGSGFTVNSFRGISFWSIDELKEMTLHYRDLCETSGTLALVPRNRASSITSATIETIFHEPCRATTRILQPEPVIAEGGRESRIRSLIHKAILRLRL